MNLVGHSLGGNVAALYAGIRPERVAKLVNLEGFGMPPTRPEQAPKRYARWLEELREPPQLRPYASFAALADRLQQGNPRLTRERAEFLARHWGREEGGRRGAARRSGAQDRQPGALPLRGGARLLAAGHRAGALGGRRRTPTR